MRTRDVIKSSVVSASAGDDGPTFSAAFLALLHTAAADTHNPPRAALAAALLHTPRLNAAAWTAAVAPLATASHSGQEYPAGAPALLAQAALATATRSDVRRALSAARGLARSARREFEAALADAATEAAGGVAAMASTAGPNAAADAAEPLLAVLGDATFAPTIARAPRAAAAALTALAPAIAAGAVAADGGVRGASAAADAVGAAVALLGGGGVERAGGSDVAAARAAVATAGDALLSLLTTGQAAPDTLAAAAAGVAAAARLPSVPDRAVAAVLGAGLCGWAAASDTTPTTAWWAPPLATTLARLPPSTALPAARGIVASAPDGVVVAAVGGGRTLLIEGGAATGAAAAAARDAPDADAGVALITAALTRFSRMADAAVYARSVARASDRGRRGLPVGGGGVTSEESDDDDAAPPSSSPTPPIHPPPPLPPAVRDAVFASLWPHLEGGTPRTAAAAHGALTAAHDALDSTARLAASADATASAATATTTILDGVLAMEPWRPGRYGALSVLAKRPGARAEVAARGLTLATDAIAALGSGAAAGPVAKALADIIIALGGARGEGRDAWVAPLARALASPHPPTRDAATEHALPAALAADPDAVVELLAAARASSPARAHALVAVACAARRCGALVDFQAAVDAADGDDIASLPLPALIDAAASDDAGLRSRALALAADDGTTARLPCPAELAIASLALAAGARGADEPPRRRAVELGRRLVARVRGGCASVLAARAGRGRGATGLDDAASLAVARTAAAWHAAFVAALVDGVAPGGHYARRWVAARLLASVAAEWRGATDAAAHKGHPPPVIGLADMATGGVICVPRVPGEDSDDADTPAPPLALLPPSFWHPATTHALLAALAGSWDKLRAAAADALAALPSPLPGLSDDSTSVAACARWASALAASPRTRDSDAAARVMGLLHDACVMQGGWGLAFGEAWAPSVVPPSPSAPPPCSRSATLLHSLLARADADLAAGRADADAAARRGLAATALRCARVVVVAARWPRAVDAASAAAALHEAVRVASIALEDTAPLLASPQVALAGAADVAAAGEGGVEYGGAEDAAAASTGGASLLRLSAAWRTAREAAALLECVAHAGGVRGPRGARPGAAAPGVPPRETLIAAGAALSAAIHTCKHAGVLDGATAALASVCGHLLVDGACEPGAWLADWHARSSAPGLSLDDIVRRSAGVPAEFVALLRGDAAAGPRPGALAPPAVECVLETAADPHAAWPARVHAFNAARAALEDAELTGVTARWIVRALEAATAGLAAGEWEVRNAASLTAAALVRRVAGAPAPAGPPPARAPTPAAAWRRHPGLHPLLARVLAEGAAECARAAAPARPLAAALALISRLRPAPGADADTQALAASVRSFAASRDAGVRALAARALTPLVPARGALAVAAQVLNGLPSAPPLPSHNEAHGRLLQARALLQAAAWPQPGGAPPASAGDTVAVAAAADAVTHTLWLATPACACAPLRAAALEVGAALVASASVLLGVEGVAGVPAVGRVAAGVAAAATAALLSSPRLGRCLLQRAAAHALAAGPAGLPGVWPNAADARAALAASDGGARAAAADALREHADASAGRVPAWVPTAAADALACLGYDGCGWVGFDTPDAPLAALQWAAALPPAAAARACPPATAAALLAGATAPPDARAAAVTLLGLAVAANPADDDAATALASAVAAAVAPTADDAERAAGAAALAQSGMLAALPATARASPARRAAAAMGAAAGLTLLQDEDGDARTSAAAAFSRAGATTRAGTPPPSPDAAPPDATLLLPGAARWAAAHGGDAPALRDALLGWVWSGDDGEGNAARSSSLRLFDVDPDNAAAEPLLAAHAAAAAIAGAPALDAGVWSGAVGAWAPRCAAALAAAAAAAASPPGPRDPPGGGRASRGDVFVRVARAAAGVTAARGLPGAAAAAAITTTAIADAAAAIASIQGVHPALAGAVAAAAAAWGVEGGGVTACAGAAAGRGGTGAAWWLAADDRLAVEE